MLKVTTKDGCVYVLSNPDEAGFYEVTRQPDSLGFSRAKIVGSGLAHIVGIFIANDDLGKVNEGGALILEPEGWPNRFSTDKIILVERFP